MVEKKMKIQWTALLLVAIIGFTGCSAKQQALQGTESETQKAEMPRTQEITHIAYRDALSDITVSPDGVYLVQQVRPASVNLFYIDAQTKKEMYLCAVPNCDHNSDACTSYLPLKEGEYGYQLFFYNDFLYITQCATTEQHAPYLMRVSPDSSGREKIVELKSGENFFGCLFGYGDSILTEISTVAENGAGGLHLEKINLQTGKRETILEYSLGRRQYSSAIGMADNKLIYIGIEENGHQYFQVDPSIPNQVLDECQQLAPLTDVFDGETVFYTVQKDYLCGLDRNTKKLSYQNLSTGEKREFDIPNLEDGDRLFGLELLYDNAFALTLNDANGIVICALFDSETGSLTGVRYKQTKENKNEVVAAFGDTLIYMVGDAEAQLKDQADFGLSGETYYYTVYGAVSKEMFLKGEKGTEIPFPKD